MFDFLKKTFPKLIQDSPYYLRVMENIIVKPHSQKEPLDGKDVFIDGKFAGRIEKMPSSFDPADSTYYRGFYLIRNDDAKKKLIDEIYHRVGKSIEDEAEARINGNGGLYSINSNILNDIKDKMNQLNKLNKKQEVVEEIKVDKNEVAYNFFAALTDLVFVNFTKIMEELRRKREFCKVYLKYNDDAVNIEIDCDYCDYDKSYRTYIWLRDRYETKISASNEEWPNRHIWRFKEGQELYPLISAVKKHYIVNGAKNDDEIKQMFVDDIAKQILERINNIVINNESNLNYAKRNYDIKQEN